MLLILVWATDLGKWLQQGKLKYEETIVEGLKIRQKHSWVYSKERI